MRSLNDRLLRRTLSALLAITIMLAPCQAAIEFDGADDYIDLKTLPLTNTSNFTISTWVNLNSIPAPYATIISLEESMGYLRIDINSARQAYGYIFTGVQNYIGLTTLNLNQWYNLTYTRNGTDYRFFVDGLLRESRALGNPVAGAGIEAIGARNTTGSNYNINGTIDDTKIYNRPLSNGEVLALYNSHSKRPSGSLVNGLIAHYEMDDDAIDEVAAQAKDSSGNLNHGQFIGFDNLTTALSKDIPTQIGAGHSLRFDGVNDYISTSTNIDDSLSSGFTISTWINANTVNDDEGIVSNYNGDAAVNTDRDGISIRKLNGNIRVIITDSGGGNNIGRDTSGNEINTATWHHIIASWNGSLNSSAIKIFVDNIRTDAVNASSGIVDSFDQSGQAFFIGATQFATSKIYFDGLIDDTKIYNKVLNNSEITFLYNGSGTDPGTSNLQALWTFDEDSALKDSSGNNNHGVGVGGDSLKYTEGILRR